MGKIELEISDTVEQRVRSIANRIYDQENAFEKAAREAIIDWSERNYENNAT